MGRVGEREGKVGIRAEGVGRVGGNSACVIRMCCHALYLLSSSRCTYLSRNIVIRFDNIGNK